MPPDDRDPDAAEVRARLRGKRVALGIVIVLATGVIGLSALQIVPAVFGIGIAPIPSAPRGSSARLCRDGLTALRDALDRARLEAARAEPTQDQAATLAAFQRALLPEWDGADAIARVCAGVPHGTDAYAALLRLRAAEEQQTRRRAVDLGPLRRDVATYLPP
jgi:hypothetical protein